MNIKSYILSLDFDKIRIYFRYNTSFETIHLDIGESSRLLEAKTGIELSNGIFNNGITNPTFKLVKEIVDPNFFQSIIAEEHCNFFPNRKQTIYDSALVFLKGTKNVGYLNISLKEKICKNNSNCAIDISDEFLNLMLHTIKNEGFEVFKNYLPPSLSVNEQWRQYVYPLELYKNPVYNTFEARINSGLFANNYKNAKIEFASQNGSIELGQLNKANYVERNRSLTRTLLLDMFWIEYLKWKTEFELPELSEKTQLYHLVELASIRIENDVDYSVQLYFKTWDEEHGQCVKYLDKDRIEFE